MEAATHPERPASRPSLPLAVGLFLLSAATLTFEINLTRLFSVAQFYHFAFMIVSIALLGFGASGAILAVFPHLGRQKPLISLTWLSLGAGLSLVLTYGLTNWIPFDSFSIAWDWRQAAILALHYVALATPFFFSGMAVSLLLDAYPQAAGETYAVNLSGSAIGCLLALAAPAALGGEGTVTLSGSLAGLAALTTAMAQKSSTFKGDSAKDSPGIRHFPRLKKGVMVVSLLGLLALTGADMGLRAAQGTGLSIFKLEISPYKGLSYLLQHPDARLIYRQWNAFSRVDVVRSQTVRSAPGLSYRYLQPLPPQDGLLVDADDLNPILRPGGDYEFVHFLSSAAPFQLAAGGEVLVLEPRGGLDVLAALEMGADQVTAVEVNPLIVGAAQSIYDRPQVQVINEFGRSYLRRTHKRFDLAVLSLVSAYHPVRSGAYSLAEDYRNTVESFQDTLGHLKPEGIMLVVRWLQEPPSESLRTYALAVTALERLGGQPETQIVAMRGYNTVALLVKRSPFTIQEIQTLRTFADQRAFDLIIAPGIQPQDINRHNVLPEPVYHRTFTALLNSPSREQFYAAYPFDVSPPSDDHPFFGHYFKWSQARQVLAELGKTSQPFGGAGYFVILAVLILALGMAGILILLPAIAAARRPPRSKPKVEPNMEPEPGEPIHPAPAFPFILYFSLIGLAFLLVEIPLIQRFILFLGHPSYALTAVLFSLLLFSSLGSRLSRRIPMRWAYPPLLALLFSLPWWLPGLFELALGLTLDGRLALTAAILAPLGLLMGVPFPAGIAWLVRDRAGSNAIPWAWGANGAASVVASVLAALLALSFNFTWVFRIGALCYLGAGLTVWVYSRKGPLQSRRR